MDLDAAFIIEMWDVFRDKVPAKEREDTAYQFLKLLNDWETDVLSMSDLREEDTHIDSALELLQEEAEEEEPDYEYDE